MGKPSIFDHLFEFLKRFSVNLAILKVLAVPIPYSVEMLQLYLNDQLDHNTTVLFIHSRVQFLGREGHTGGKNSGRGI